MRGSQTLVPVGTSSIQVIGCNPKRASIIFAGDGTNVFTISQITPVVANRGVVIGTTLTAIEFGQGDLGYNITLPFFAICSASGGFLTIIESFY